MKGPENAIFRMSFGSFDLSLKVIRNIFAICNSDALLDVQY